MTSYFTADLAMGQIPCSTERIASFNTIRLYDAFFSGLQTSDCSRNSLYTSGNRTWYELVFCLSAMFTNLPTTTTLLVYTTVVEWLLTNEILNK